MAIHAVALATSDCVIPEFCKRPAFHRYVYHLGEKPQYQEHTDHINSDAHLAFDSEHSAEEENNGELDKRHGPRVKEFEYPE